MMARRFPILLLGLALVASACGGKGLGVEASGQAIRAATGYAVRVLDADERWKPKPFAGPRLGGGRVTSELLTGKVAVVNFWASWCGPCRAEQPELETLWKRYGPQGVQFLGVNVRDTPANARAHIEEFGVTYPSLYNQDSTVAYTFRVLFIPTTFVLDRRGRVAARIIGVTRADDLTRVLDGELS